MKGVLAAKETEVVEEVVETPEAVEQEQANVAEGTLASNENTIIPSGKGEFGNIYTQFKNKVKDAIVF